MFTVFHLPFRNTMIPAIVIADSASNMAVKTPVGPNFKIIASKYATGTWNNQNPKILITVGVLVSPAPLNELVTTIPTPYNIKPSDIILNAFIA